MRWLCVLSYLVCSASIWADEPRAVVRSASPAVVVTLAPLDHLVNSGVYFANLVDQGEAAKQARGIYKTLTGPKGLEGIDTTRPIQAYAALSENITDSPFALIVPIADEAAFLEAIEKYGIPLKKGRDGIHEIQVPNSPLPIYFTFANRSAYFTARSKDALKPAQLLAPEKLPQVPADTILHLSLRPSVIPKAIKQLAIGQIEMAMAAEKANSKPNETAAEKALKEAALDYLTELASEFINSTEDIAVGFRVDPKSDRINFSTFLKALDGSKLAEMLTFSANSSIGGMLKEGDAIGVSMALAIPEKLREPLTKVLREEMKKGLANEPDAKKRQLGEQGVALVLESIQKGRAEGVIGFRGARTSETLNFFIALRAAGLNKLDGLIRTAVKLDPPPPGKFVLDAEKINGVSAHRMANELFNFDPNMKQLLGPADGLLAIHQDMLIIAVGSTANALLADLFAAKSAELLPMKAEMSFWEVIRTNIDTRKYASDVLKKLGQAPAPGSDTLTTRLTMKGGVAMSLTVTGQGLRLAFLTDQAKKNSETRE